MTYMFKIAYDRNGAREGRPWEVILTDANGRRQTIYVAKVRCLVPSEYVWHPASDNITTAQATSEGLCDDAVLTDSTLTLSCR